MIKAVILAGGLGTRLAEETEKIPKPMVSIGGRPILWHIMKIYSHYGINDFVICCGYKGEVIKEYFLNYLQKYSNLSINLKNNHIDIHDNSIEPWRITFIDTGLHSMTGGRLKRVGNLIKNDSFFCLTYGDGVSNVNLNLLIEFHLSHKKCVSVTAVKPPGRFGALKINENYCVNSIEEKPEGDNSWINGGFFICNPDVLDEINGDETIFEQEPLANLAHKNELMAFKHHGFWQPMDTLRERKILEDLWDKQNAPWKLWH